MGGKLAQGMDGVHSESLNKRGLARILSRQVELAEAGPLRAARHHKRAAQWPEHSVKGKLSKKELALRVKGELAGGQEVRKRNSEVKGGALLFKICGRERDNHLRIPLLRRFEAGIFYGGGNPVFGFFNSLVGESDNGEGMETLRDVYLNINNIRRESTHLRAHHLCEHRLSL